MKVLFVSSDFYGQIGGKSTHIFMLMKGLEKLGHNSRLILPPNNFFTKLMVGGIGKIFDLFGLGIFARHFLFRKLLNISVTTKLVAAEKFDVINAEDPDAVLAVHEISLKAPVVLTVHGELATELKAAGHVKHIFEDKCFFNLEQKSYNLSDVIIAVDNRIKEHIATLIPMSKEKINLIYNFIDVTSFAEQVSSLNGYAIKKELEIPQDTRVVLVPRRLMKKCGVIFAIKAIEILIEENKVEDVLLMIIGSGPEYENLVKYVNEGGLQNHVIFKGDVPYLKMPKFYAISDAVLIPSISVYGYKEATSLSAIEAMASKVPVIASNIGGLAELIENNKTGILVPEQSAEEIAKNILMVFNNPVMRKQLVDNAFEYILLRHHYENATKEFVTRYEEAIERYNSRISNKR